MKKEYQCAAVSIFFWSTVATVTKLLMGTISHIQLLWASAFFAALFWLVVNTVTGRIKLLKTYTLRQIGTIALIGLPGTFFYYVFYYAGAARMQASQAFIINYLWPIMSVVFACVLLKERFTFRKAMGIGLSFVGVVIVTCGELSAFTADTLTGAVLCICGAVSYGLFAALNKKMGYDKRLSMMINYIVTFVLTTIMHVWNRELFLPSAVQTLGIAWNGILTMAVASTCWMLALERGKTERVSNLAYITPFLSLIWTALILKEEFRVINLLGLLVIVGGILIQFLEPKHKEEC